MLPQRKAKDPAQTPSALVPAVAPVPVSVVVVVEPRRGRRKPAKGEDEADGHPLVKAVLGFAVAKRLVRRRKRPVGKRVRKAVRKGRRKVKRTARKVRRALR